MPDCNDCGDYIDLNDDECQYCGDCDVYAHNDCELLCGDDEYGGSRGYGVHSWDYKPHTYRPKGNYPFEALLGVELEVGGYAREISRAVRSVDENEHHLYMKDDGSISGVEIVTHPATLAWSRGFDYEYLLSSLVARGCHVDDGYGLHIHVSRNAFRVGGKRSNSHAMTWLMFLYRNAGNVQALARREDSRWATFRRPRPGELKRKSGDFPSNDDRYVAVNCNNERTYELRMFMSTLDVVEFRAAMEFADASVEYTRSIATADVLRGNGMKWSHFIEWVAHYPDKYGNLASELARVSMDDEPTIIPGPDYGVFRMLQPRLDASSYVGDTMTLLTAANVAGNGGLIARYDAMFAVRHSDAGTEMAQVGSTWLTPEEYANIARRIDDGDYYSWRDHSAYISHGWYPVATR